MPSVLYLKKLKYFTFLVLFNFCVLSVKGQREYSICDSTEYILNNDTSVIAGRNHIYLYTSTGINLLYNFSQPDTNYYIRDFDIVNSNLWFTLIGSRYIGSPTILYRSGDQGVHWLVDTSFYSATRTIDSTSYYNSINQVNEIGSDTILLFMGYYYSGIAYSTDGGNTWKNWFQNLITHYHGIFKCNSEYYLFGLEGDAFRPSMFAFQKENLFRNDSLVNFNHFSPTSVHPPCYNGLHPDCVHAYSNLSRCGQYLFFKNYTDSICSLTTNTVEIDNNENFSIYPNPADQTITVAFPEIENETWDVEIYDLKGVKYFLEKSISPGSSQTIVMQVKSLPVGIYLITLQSENYWISKKIIIL